MTMTTDPASFTGDTSKELRAALMTASLAAKQRPVLIEPAEWAEENP